MTSNEDIYDTLKLMREKRNETLPDNSVRKTLSLESSSLKRYTSIIKRIYRLLKTDEPPTPELFIERKKDIVDILKDKPSSTRRHDYTALRVYTNDDDFAKYLAQDNLAYASFIKDRQRTTKQTDNWVTKKEILQTLNALRVESDAVYAKHANDEELTMTDYQTIQNYLLLMVSSDKYMPIRRSLDWIEFKIQDYDTEKDNYMTDDMIVFNKYKTGKTKGQQRLIFNNYKKRGKKYTNPDWDFYSKSGAKEIKTQLQKWIKLNPTQYLFFDKNRNQLNQTNITHKFNKMFGKKVSINMLRVILKTEKEQSVLNALADAQRSMIAGGSSANMLRNYVKNLMGI